MACLCDLRTEHVCISGSVSTILLGYIHATALNGSKCNRSRLTAVPPAPLHNLGLQAILAGAFHVPI
jgi:hypothetical protein